MKPYRIVYLLMLAVLSLPLAAGAAFTELPLTRVVLFSSGMGNFVHSGTVEGDARVVLHFSPDQMNDVLKSMVVNDLDGGTVGGISYPSRDPLEKTLQSFAVDLSGNPPLADLLNQLRGTPVQIDTPDPVSGRILGVETRTRKVLSGAETTLLTEHILNLDTADGVESVPLDTVARIRLTDEDLNRELQQALDTLARSVDRQRKTLVVRFLGKGPRRVRIGYILEAPVWKTAYRLDLHNDQSLLQGWAIVENTSDSDWKQVQLELVSGRPISFIQDLYTPRYLRRPEVAPPGQAPVRPRLYEQGMPKKALSDSLAVKARKAAPLAVAPAGQVLSLESETSGIQRGVQAAVAAAKAGELFKFTVKRPVNLARRRSAMFPIINQPVKTEKVSIYNASQLRDHPMNGLWLHNDTGTALPPGPVTVYDEVTYAGDALLGSLSPGASRLLGYAVDLEVLVDASGKSDQRLTAVKIVDGTLTETRLMVWTRTYRLKNSADRDRVIVLEHPFTPGRKLVEPADYAEKTDRYYRFKVPLSAGEQKAFVVQEQYVRLQRTALLDMPVEQLVYYAGNAEVPPAVKKALENLAAMKRELEALKTDRRQLEERTRAITRDQDRIRKNIQSVGPGSQLGKRYLEKLGNQETQLDQIHKRMEVLDQQIRLKNKALADTIAKLSVE